MIFLHYTATLALKIIIKFVEADILLTYKLETMLTGVQGQLIILKNGRGGGKISNYFLALLWVKKIPQLDF